MRKLLVLAAGCTVAVCVAQGGKRGEAQWEERVWDFGVIAEDSGAVGHSFGFLNVGDSALTVLGARAGCGCTTPRIPADAVGPGERGAVGVSYDPAGRPGRFRKTVRVTTTGGDATLTVSGVVMGNRQSMEWQWPAEFGPLRMRRGMVNFGTVERGKMKTVMEQAYNPGRDSARVRVVGKPRWMEVDLEPQKAGPGETVTMVCHLRSGEVNGAGHVEDTLWVECRGERVGVPVVANITAGVKLR